VFMQNNNKKKQNTLKRSFRINSYPSVFYEGITVKHVNAHVQLLLKQCSVLLWNISV